MDVTYVDKTVHAANASADTVRGGGGAGASAETELDFEPPLYAPQRKIYPQSVTGRFRTIKWALLIVTLGIYYILPFVRWDRGPNAPDQAVLIDFPGRRFYFFFIEIWPQEVYYLTGLLILAAMGLFLMNAVAGRIWCGYLCPQTVWTDLFLAVERLFEGDRRERILRDSGPWTVERVAMKTMKHFTWLMIAWWTGGAWVLYFADAPTLVKSLATGQAPFVAYVWIGILTFTTYALAGHMRDQVCTYMCPWPRIQAALIDEYALNVTYRYDRGEPRCSIKQAAQLRAKGQAAGDCIDCFQCVHVCPTGVDIRNGLQLECIQCGLCIDACDTVMRKIGRPTGLIAYDTDINIKRRLEGKTPFVRIVRVRTLLYAAVIVLAGGIMLYTLATRASIGINVIHDRNPLFVQLSGGGVRNGYTVHVINKSSAPRRFQLSVEGLPGSVDTIVGVEAQSDGRLVVDVGPDQTRELRVLVTDYNPQRPASAPVIFHLRDIESGERVNAPDNFRGP
jgi:cytochrome c oxidase accessory protein FixG